MGNVDATVRKARARVDAAERDQKATARTAVIAEERARRAKLTLKKAKKRSKKAAKVARKARKAAVAATAALTKAIARATEAQAGVAKRRRAERKGVSPEVAAAKREAAKTARQNSAARVASKKRARRVAARSGPSQHGATTAAHQRKRGPRVGRPPAPSTEPAIPALEGSDNSETFLMGTSDLR
jgi:hypothetical protein